MGGVLREGGKLEQELFEDEKTTLNLRDTESLYTSDDNIAKTPMPQGLFQTIGFNPVFCGRT